VNYNKILLISLIILIASFASYYYATQPRSTQDNTVPTDGNVKKEIFVEGSLFRILTRESDLQVDYNTRTITYSNADFELKPELTDTYHRVGLLNQAHNTVVIYPTFTESAYNKGGFYDYYEQKCDQSCLTIPISTGFDGEYSSSRAAFNSLRLLGYHYITDVDVDRDPDVLQKYDKVILLHNEYVTENEFAAITKHPKVVYLYPNALYAKVSSDYTNNTITLIRGHGYPSHEIRNGFGWEFDNSHLEYDNTCMNWEFYKVDNGIMLDCYPEYIIFKDEKLLEAIKNY
jgi:hypothetical protein